MPNFGDRRRSDVLLGVVSGYVGVQVDLLEGSFVAVRALEARLLAAVQSLVRGEALLPAVGAAAAVALVNRLTAAHLRGAAIEMMCVRGLLVGRPAGGGQVAQRSRERLRQPRQRRPTTRRQLRGRAGDFLVRAAGAIGRR